MSFFKGLKSAVSDVGNIGATVYKKAVDTVYKKPVEMVWGKDSSITRGVSTVLDKVFNPQYKAIRTVSGRRDVERAGNAAYAAEMAEVQGQENARKMEEMSTRAAAKEMEEAERRLLQYRRMFPGRRSVMSSGMYGG